MRKSEIHINAEIPKHLAVEPPLVCVFHREMGEQGAVIMFVQPNAAYVFSIPVVEHSYAPEIIYQNRYGGHHLRVAGNDEVFAVWKIVVGYLRDAVGAIQEAVVFRVSEILVIHAVIVPVLPEQCVHILAFLRQVVKQVV